MQEVFGCGRNRDLAVDNIVAVYVIPTPHDPRSYGL